MGYKSPDISGTNTQIIGRGKQIACCAEWLADQEAETQIFSIVGIGGMGKTTLLMEFANMARRASALTLWLDGQTGLRIPSAFLSNIEMILENEYGRFRDPNTPLLSHIISEFSKQRTVLFLDNCDNIDIIESWLLSSFLTKLNPNGVLLVFASRTALPLKWHTHPYWANRIQSFHLDLFSREEVHEYLQERYLPETVQKEIVQKTEGHPLLLALTMDSLFRQKNDATNTGNIIPGILSAEMLKEVTSPSLYDVLHTLALLPFADQTILNRLVDTPVDTANYHSLGKLSFVRVTSHGLTLHNVVSRVLREEFYQRDPQKFQMMRQKAVMALAEQFHFVKKQMQMQIVSHVLELYREYLPSAHQYVDFSSIRKSKTYQPFQSGDLSYLHQILSVSISQSNWQCELVKAEDYHALLDEIATHCPEGILVVRSDYGIPLAFCAGLWFHSQTMPVLDRYAPQFSSDILGEEALPLQSLPRELADSICVLLAAVNVEQRLYRPEELGALLLQDFLTYMTIGARGIVATADPQLNNLLPQFGFRKRTPLPQADFGAIKITAWELDFRHVTFDEWVQTIIHQMGQKTGNWALQPMNEPTILIRETDVEQILKNLYDVRALEKLSIVRKIHIPGAIVQQRIQSILTDETPMNPLTRQEQKILRESFLQKEKSRTQLAETFNMSRTTFYRHSQRAMKHLGYVLSRLFFK